MKIKKLSELTEAEFNSALEKKVFDVDTLISEAKRQRKEFSVLSDYLIIRDSEYNTTNAYKIISEDIS